MEIEGLTIKKGLDCTVSLLALHFMPEYWENPHTFNPQRFSAENKAKLDHYAFMPFGFGPRNCIGQRLALLEMKMTIVGLLQRYRFTKTDNLKDPMPHQKKIVLKPADQIVVNVEIRETKL